MSKRDAIPQHSLHADSNRVRRRQSQGEGSEDECIGCFSLFQFSADTDGAALERALQAAAQPRGPRSGGSGAGAASGSDSEPGDDVALEVNSWWLEHLEERVWCCLQLCPCAAC